MATLLYDQEICFTPHKGTKVCKTELEFQIWDNCFVLLDKIYSFVRLSFTMLLVSCNPGQALLKDELIDKCFGSSWVIWVWWWKYDSWFWNHDYERDARTPNLTWHDRDHLVQLQLYCLVSASYILMLNLTALCDEFSKSPSSVWWCVNIADR